MQIDGKLSKWNDDRGFGFITPTLGGQEIFVHIKAFKGFSGRPQIGQRLAFEIEIGPEGKKRAKNVELVRVSRASRRHRVDSPAQWGTASYFALPAFVLLFVLIQVLWRPPGWVAALYLAASAISFLVYAIDKSAAVAGRWRVSEGTLHMLGLIGGWPGAIVAQQVLRHKSNKAEFRSAFWGSVVVNVVLFVVLSSPLGPLVRA